MGDSSSLDTVLLAVTNAYLERFVLRLTFRAVKAIRNMLTHFRRRIGLGGPVQAHLHPVERSW